MPRFAYAAHKEHRNGFDGICVIICVICIVWKLVNKYKSTVVSIQEIASDCVQIRYNVQASFQESSYYYFSKTVSYALMNLQFL